MNKNNYILSVNETSRLIKTAYLNPVIKPKSFLIIGESGIGKTEAIEAIAKELGITYKNIRTPEIDPSDLVGFWNPATGTYKAPLLPDSKEKAIILLDEINRGQLPTSQACMRIMEGRGTSSWEYNPELHLVVGAANPIGDDDVVEILGRALINRPYIIFCEPNLDEWVDWVYGVETKKIEIIKKEEALEESKKWLKKIAQFLLAYPKYFLVKGTSEQAARFESVPNPRNWEEASKIIVLFDIAKIDRSISARIATKVGFEAAAEFEAFIEDPEPPVTGIQILNEYSKYKYIFIKHQKEAIHKAIATSHDLSIVLNTKNKLTKEEIKNLKEFLESIDTNREEIAMSLFNRLNNKIFDELFNAIPEFFERNLKIINEIKKKFKM